MSHQALTSAGLVNARRYILTEEFRAVPGVSSLLHLAASILIEVVVTWMINEVDSLNSCTNQPILAAPIR